MSTLHNFHKKFPGKKIISVDFDGVLHHYTSEWAGPLVITDPPTPGAIPWLVSLVHHKRIVVVIHSCRLEDPKAEEAISTWLFRHINEFYLNQEPPENRDKDQERWAQTWARFTVVKIQFSYTKPPAAVYIDDRGYQFRGEFPDVNYLLNYVPWNKVRPKVSGKLVQERDVAQEALMKILHLCETLAERDPATAAHIRRLCADGSPLAAQLTRGKQ